MRIRNELGYMNTLQGAKTIQFPVGAFYFLPGRCTILEIEVFKVRRASILNGVPLGR